MTDLPVILHVDCLDRHVWSLVQIDDGRRYCRLLRFLHIKNDKHVNTVLSTLLYCYILPRSFFTDKQFYRHEFHTDTRIEKGDTGKNGEGVTCN